jgi:hypothetical protein
VFALVAGVRAAAGHPAGPEIAAGTGLATRAGHQPSGRRSSRKQRTVNPLIAPARYNFLYFLQGRPCGRPPAALRPGCDPTVTGAPGLTLQASQRASYLLSSPARTDRMCSRASRQGCASTPGCETQPHSQSVAERPAGSGGVAASSCPGSTTFIVFSLRSPYGLVVTIPPMLRIRCRSSFGALPTRQWSPRTDLTLRRAGNHCCRAGASVILRRPYPPRAVATVPRRPSQTTPRPPRPVAILVCPGSCLPGLAWEQGRRRRE